MMRTPSPELPTLTEFLCSPAMCGLRNQWIRYKNMEIYVRTGPKIVGRASEWPILKVITIANITNYECEENLYFDPNHKPIGHFREFDQLVKQAAIDFDYDGVFVESVINKFLPDVLIRYGYEQVVFPYSNEDIHDIHFYYSRK